MPLCRNLQPSPSCEDTRMNDTVHKQRGLTIVEALVTMVILMIVLGGVYQIFQSATLTYRMQEGLSRVQENGRFAIDFMSKDVRMAGYRGCIANIPITNTLNDSSNFSYNFDVGIEGFTADDDLEYPLQHSSGTWSNNIESSIPKSTMISRLGVTNIFSGSDVLTIRKAMGEDIVITKHPGGDPPGSADLQTKEGNNFKQFDIVIVSDCVAAAVFQITNANPSTSGNIVHNTGVGYPGNETKKLGKEFTGGDISVISLILYYINLNQFGKPSLYKRSTAEGSSQELVEGIEMMKILYGEDTIGDNNVDTYHDAMSVSDWSRVKSVQIGLLVRTPDEIRGMELDTREYNVLGTIVGPANDLHIRRVFTTTVGLRNRLK